MLLREWKLPLREYLTRFSFSFLYVTSTVEMFSHREFVASTLVQLSTNKHSQEVNSKVKMNNVPSHAAFSCVCGKCACDACGSRVSGQRHDGAERFA